MANIGSLEIPRIFLVCCESAEYFPHFSRGIQNQENEQVYSKLRFEIGKNEFHKMGRRLIVVFEARLYPPEQPSR